MTTEHVLAKDIAAFERMKVDLQEHHDGKFMVFHNGELEGSFDSFDSAARDALKRFRDTPFLIRQVGAPEVMPMPASAAFRPANTAS